MATNTKTITTTDARYLGSKIAADLRQLQLLYGKPSDSQIDNYVEEFVQLVKDGYLDSCSYGFKKNGSYVVGVSYEVAQFNNTDDNPGRIPVGVDIMGATWSSFLSKSWKFYGLSSTQQQQIENNLPISRGNGSDPAEGANATYDRSYGSGDVELKRKTFK